MLKKVDVKIKKLHPDAKLPSLGTPNAVGFDIYSIEECLLEPGGRKAVSTGIATEFPQGTAVIFKDRSGMGFKGIHVFGGVIDSDYRGEYKVILFNSTKEPFKIEKGDRICQAVLIDYFAPNFIEVDELTDSLRGEGRFGSTGMK